LIIYRWQLKDRDVGNKNKIPFVKIKFEGGNHYGKSKKYTSLSPGNA